MRPPAAEAMARIVRFVYPTPHHTTQVHRFKDVLRTAEVAQSQAQPLLQILRRVSGHRADG